MLRHLLLVLLQLFFCFQGFYVLLLLPPARIVFKEKNIKTEYRGRYGGTFLAVTKINEYIISKEVR